MWGEVVEELEEEMGVGMRAVVGANGVDMAFGSLG